MRCAGTCMACSASRVRPRCSWERPARSDALLARCGTAVRAGTAPRFVGLRGEAVLPFVRGTGGPGRVGTVRAAGPDVGDACVQGSAPGGGGAPCASDHVSAESALGQQKPCHSCPPHRRQHQRLHSVRAGHDRDPRPSHRSRPTPHDTGPRDRRQGVQLSQDPHLPAQTRHPPHDPRMAGTKPPAAADVHPPAADRPASIGPSTASATSSNAASTASGNGAAWPPATPKARESFQAAVTIASILLWI